MEKGTHPARIHLIEERKRHQWSQQELADQLGTTQHNVSRWERGQTLPGSYFRTKLCELFGTSPQELGFLSEAKDAQSEDDLSASTSVFTPAELPLPQHVPRSGQRSFCPW